MAAPEHPTARTASSPRLRIEVVEGPDRGLVTVPAGTAPVSVGAASDCDVVLSDRSVSRYHVELAHVAEGIRVQDLGSLTGTWIGDARLDRGVVRPAARLRLGDSVLRIQACETEPEPSTARAVPEVPTLVGASPTVHGLRAAAARLAAPSTPVLVVGEKGAGKETFARAIHALGPRRGRPFEVVDCRAATTSHLAAELFGSAPSALTGGRERSAGAFERASGGTLLLAGTEELPLALQPELLDALERRRVRPAGGGPDLTVDVRLVAATRCDLRPAVNRGAFRADLYARLAAARIEIPPLRDRPEDLEPLLLHFVRELTGRSEASPVGPAMLEALRAQPWPTNGDGLRRVVESTLRFAPRGAAEATGPGTTAPYAQARARALHEFEQGYLAALLGACGGNVVEAARRAQMERALLVRLLGDHGLT